jgi:hypothetical protein
MPQKLPYSGQYFTAVAIFRTSAPSVVINIIRTCNRLDSSEHMIVETRGHEGSCSHEPSNMRSKCCPQGRQYDIVSRGAVGSSTWSGTFPCCTSSCGYGQCTKVWGSRSGIQLTSNCWSPFQINCYNRRITWCEYGFHEEKPSADPLRLSSP